MREMASAIKTEVRGELNATRKRLHQIASDCRLQHSDDSGQFLQVDLPGKGEKSHVVPKTTACKE